MKLFTIGYGGRHKDELISMLRENYIQVVVDVRLRPGLHSIKKPFCLLCAEKNAVDCHRKLIADYLIETKGVSVVHLE